MLKNLRKNISIEKWEKLTKLLHTFWITFSFSVVWTRKQGNSISPLSSASAVLYAYRLTLSLGTAPWITFALVSPILQLKKSKLRKTRSLNPGHTTAICRAEVQTPVYSVCQFPGCQHSHHVELPTRVLQTHSRQTPHTSHVSRFQHTKGWSRKRDEARGGDQGRHFRRWGPRGRQRQTSDLGRSVIMVGSLLEDF